MTGAEPGPGPFAFTARTETSYAVPLARAVVPSEERVVISALVDCAPLPVIGAQVVPPSVEYSYERIALPPSEGADHDSVIFLSPGIALTPVGANGVVEGVPDTAAEAGLVPISFVAVTVNEYWVPFVNPAKVIGLAVPVFVIFVVPPSGVAVTVYDVIALPPSNEGGVNDTVACLSPAATETLVGASGGTA